MTLTGVLIRQVRVRHQPAVPFLRVVTRGIFEELAQVGLAAKLRDLGQVRRIVRALAEQRMAVDAVLAMPHMLPRDDLGR